MGMKGACDEWRGKKLQFNSSMYACTHQDDAKGTENDKGSFLPPLVGSFVCESMSSSCGLLLWAFTCLQANPYYNFLVLVMDLELLLLLQMPAAACILHCTSNKTKPRELDRNISLLHNRNINVSTGCVEIAMDHHMDSSFCLPTTNKMLHRLSPIHNSWFWYYCTNSHQLCIQHADRQYR